MFVTSYMSCVLNYRINNDDNKVGWTRVGKTVPTHPQGVAGRGLDGQDPVATTRCPIHEKSFTV